MTAKPEFNYVTFIDAPREKVWQALTEPEFTKRYWFNSTVESDWKEGSDYTFRVPDDKGGERVVLTGKIIKVDKPKELVYQFTAPWNEAARDEDSTVQFLLEEIEGMTKLSVRHYDFQEGSILIGEISSGWPMVLSGLKTLLESGKELNLSH
ncbi:MAG: SRPBCC family protein [Proteobacteria bacterium]|nr:SRPBCC family protein [Pseudomonadota bacterium]